MSSFKFNFPDDVCKLLESISNDDELEKECLEAVRDITTNSVSNELHKHDRTKEMANSVKCSSPSANSDGDGYHIFVHPTGDSEYICKDGKTKYKISNVMKAVWLEYGSSHQTAQPWIEKAKANCEDQVIDAMQKVINRKVGK